MIKYTYTLSASESLRGKYTSIKGEIFSEYPLPNRELKTIAMKMAPKEYVTFGMLYVLSEEVVD